MAAPWADESVLAQIVERIQKLRYYPDGRHVYFTEQIAALARAHRELSGMMDTRAFDLFTLIEDVTAPVFGRASVRECRKLETVIQRYLDDPEFQPGPEHVREAVAPTGDPGSGIDCCTTPAGSRQGYETREGAD